MITTQRLLDIAFNEPGEKPGQFARTPPDVNDNKIRLIRASSMGWGYPPEGSETRRLLENFCNEHHEDYDAEFVEAIRKIRPKWVPEESPTMKM